MDKFIENINNKFQSEIKTIKVSEMKMNKNFKIINLKRIPTKFGERVILTTKSFKIFLPIRFNKLGEKEMRKLENGCYSVINEGECGPTYKIKFKRIDMEEFEEEDEEVEAEEDSSAEME